MKQSKSSLVEAIRAASQEKAAQTDQHSGKPDTPKDIEERTVTLSIRVSKRKRLHWLIEAKRQGTSLTETIIEALNARFPQNTDY